MKISLSFIRVEASGLTVCDSVRVVSNAKVKKRKDAWLTEKTQYAKQFAEAKQAEYQSCVENNVFDLIDIRKTKYKKRENERKPNKR